MFTLGVLGFWGLVDVVVRRVVDVADEEAEVQRGGQHDEETEYDFLEIGRASCRERV